MAVARADVAASLQFVEQLRDSAARQFAALPFPQYLSRKPGSGKWLAHDTYEKELVGACYAELLPEWRVRLAGAELSLRSHCWSMIVAQAVQMP